MAVETQWINHASFRLAAEAVVYHFGDIVGSAEDADAFAAAAGCAVHVLAPGEAVTIEAR